MNDAYLFLLKETWRGLLPALGEAHIAVLKYFVENYPNAYSSYAVAKVTRYNFSTVYRVVKHLRDHRLILPVPDKRLRASVKGALSLLVLTSDPFYINCIKKIWNIDIKNEVLLSYLILLGEALRRFGFNIREAFICHPAGSVAYVVPYFMERPSTHFFVLQNSLEFLKWYRTAILDFEKLEKMCLNNDICIKYGLCNVDVSKKLFKRL